MDQKKSLSKISFIISVLGYTIGLGSIWSFPTQIFNYGGVFFIPFFISLIICALPILIVEINWGNRLRQNHIYCFSNVKKKTGRFLGYFQSVNVVTISTFYAIVTTWSVIMVYKSFSQIKEVFKFDQEVLEINDGSIFEKMKWWILIVSALVWVITLLISVTGVTKGIDIANKIFMFLLLFIIIFLISAIFIKDFESSKKGLNDFLFNFSKEKMEFLKRKEIWKDAFSQSFFMTSACTGTIIIFSSHTEQKDDNTLKAIIIVIAIAIMSLMMGILVICGIYMKTKGIESIENTFEKGPMLVFNVFPSIFNSLGFKFTWLISSIFFFGVAFAGFSSLVGMIESLADPLIKESKYKRKTVLFFIMIFAFFFGSIYCFNNSIFLIDGTSFWATGMLMLIFGFVECIIINLKNEYQSFIDFNNKNSYFKFGKIFGFIIKIICPIVILINIIFGFIDFHNKIVYGTKKDIYFIGLFLGLCIPFFISLILTFWNKKLIKKNSKLNY
jgi:neurotransmitter:Na+ symporter, NSS family